MIAADTIHQLVREKIDQTDLFLIDIAIKPGNKIVVLIDSMKGLSVDDCVKVSRHIEFSLDREQEDFELQVSSPGADSPFKVIEQYKKHVGKTIDLLAADNTKFSGKLLSSTNDEIVLEVTSAEKKAGKKSKKIEQHTFKYNQIKQAKATISFK